jgi:nitrite reductase (NADH) small subunit
MSERERDLHVVGTLADFPLGGSRVVTIGRREIGIFNIHGVLYALPNLCPHQTGPLCETPRTTGTLTATEADDWRPSWVHDGEVISCPWHGMEFHVPTGRCIALKEIKLRHYEVVVDGDRVRVRV